MESLLLATEKSVAFSNLSCIEFLKYLSLYTNTLRRAMTDKKFRTGMQFQNKDGSIITIKHYFLKKLVDYNVMSMIQLRIQEDPTHMVMDALGGFVHPIGKIRRFHRLKNITVLTLAHQQ